MLTCREVYSESFASKIKGIARGVANSAKAGFKIAAKTYAPKLTAGITRDLETIKNIRRAFNEPRAALKDLFESEPDIFRNCKLKELIKDSAAGVAVGTAGDSYKGSYKAIFTGSVKNGNEANSPLENSNNFSVTIKPTERRGEDGIKYVADRTVFKDDVEFTNVSSSAIDQNAEYLKLFKTTTILQNKFQLDRPIFFDPQGAIDRRDSSKGFRLNFNGKVTFGSTSRDVDKDEYIIVINNRGKLQSDGKLYKGVPGTLMLSNVNINYSQKDILIESKKLVDLFCK
jgi:hypothetical protein